MRKEADLLTHARRASTKESYATKWTRFHDFCRRTLPRVYNHKPERALPAKRRTVIKYLAHLQLEGRVHVNSLQPYLLEESQERCLSFSRRSGTVDGGSWLFFWTNRCV